MLRGFEDSIPLYSGGLYVAGEKLMVTKADDQSIYAEKVRHFNFHFSDGSLIIRILGQRGRVCGEIIAIDSHRSLS